MSHLDYLPPVHAHPSRSSVLIGLGRCPSLAVPNRDGVAAICSRLLAMFLISPAFTRYLDFYTRERVDP